MAAYTAPTKRKSKSEKADEAIISRAHDNFDKAVSWERAARQLYVDDMRFLFADSDNQDQWPAAVRARRLQENQPMLTVNKTHTHWLHVVNQAKSNRPSIQVHPVGSDATYQAAQVYESVIRHIEYASDASTAYAIAAENQVGGGIGYWRLVTEYADDNGFDQEIFIRPIPDSLAVYMDPPKRRDGSDSRWCFVYDDMDRDVFEKKYPDAPVNVSMGSMTSSGWLTKDRVRVAEYYEVEESKEWMYAIPDGNDGHNLMRESDLTDEQHELLDGLRKSGQHIQARKVTKREVKCYLIAGDKILERSTWAGQYIPIIRVVGEEVIIDGRMDRKGLVRYMKDPQRMYNYNTSAQVEFGGLQGKMPYLAPVEAIEGFENYWSTANTQNHSVLPYNHADENGSPIPPPQRQQPPQAAEAYSVGMQAASMEMMMASGQYDATFGAKGQEYSGIALDNRREQGERATFHYLDNWNNAIRYCGKQLIDLIPKVYDTKRIIRIMGDDGKQSEIVIDPKAKQALQQQEDQKENIIRSIFNPTVGTYDVVAKSGPNYETKREEAFEAMKGLITGVPALAQVIGDLFAKMGDFPMSDAIAERIRNWIPADIRGDGPSPAEQQLQQQLQQAVQMIQQLQEALNSKDAAESIAKQRADMDALNHLAIRMENERESAIAAFKAETDRLGKLLMAIPPEMIAMLGTQTGQDALSAPQLALQSPSGNLNGAEAYAAGLVQTDLGNTQQQMQPSIPST
jgi:hypothetical protein